VGKAGLEREYDDTLRGTEGVRYIEVNARGRLVREGAPSATLSPTPGKPIVTTVDLDLQQFVDSIWPAGVRGAMVAMTPNGEIRALYSAPNFDPNHFVGGISSAEWKRLNNDPAKPLLNRVMQARYPPASPFKLAIAAMALKRGLIQLNSYMPEPCRGGMRLGNRVFRCWKRELESAGQHPQLCHRPRREYPDPDQHDEVLRRPGRHRRGGHPLHRETD